jgi:hypothetical protein
MITNINKIYNYTPLQKLVKVKPPANLVKRILELAPKTVEVLENGGCLPLHHALFNTASPTVIKVIFAAYSKATQVQNNEGCLPLYTALICKAELVPLICYC